MSTQLYNQETIESNKKLIKLVEELDSAQASLTFYKVPTVIHGKELTLSERINYALVNDSFSQRFPSTT